jgi:nitroimidazol reductase NimA-like FMN-containing flavoprotein (pyridoxamine 5'-phosphate oxidase superfamily)
MKDVVTEPWVDPFLRDRRVAVLAISRGDRAPLTTPVWYDYDGACFRIQVEATSAKAKAVARRGTVPVSLAVQSEVPPYRYVVVYGAATLRATGDAALRRRVARRYFGRLAGDSYVAQEEQRGVAAGALRIVEVVPERVVTHDFRPEAGRFGRLYFALWRRLRPVPA